MADIVGVSWGKPLNFFNCHTKLASLVRASFGGGARDRPVSTQTFTGRSTSKCLNIFFFQRTDRNFYKLVHVLERGHMNLHKKIIDIIVTVAFCNFGSFSCNRDGMQSEKNTLEGGPLAPLMRETVPLLGVMIFRFKKLPFPFGKIVNSVSKGFLNGNSVWP